MYATNLRLPTILLFVSVLMRPCGAQFSSGSNSSAAPVARPAADTHTTPSILFPSQLHPAPFRLVLDGYGEFSVVLYERSPSSVVQQNAYQILRHKYKNLPGSPPREIERHKVFWGLLSDGTCIYSNAPTGRGAPYVYGKLDPQKLGAVRERARRLVETGRDPDLRYPWMVCTMSIATVHLQAAADGVAVSAEIPGPDFNSALVSRSGTSFHLNAAQENYRRRFADLVRPLNALRKTSYDELGPVPESTRVRSVQVPAPRT